MATWQLQEAKAKLSKVIDLTHTEGAQVVTRNGVPVVAIVPIEEWRSMETKLEPKKQTTAEWLAELRRMPGGLDDDGFELLIPKRKARKRRPLPEFD